MLVMTTIARATVVVIAINAEDNWPPLPPRKEQRQLLAVEQPSSPTPPNGEID
jgi:hypothetical protein